MENENFDIIEVRSKNDIPFFIWSDIPEAHIPTEAHKGLRIWVAGEAKSIYRELKQVHQLGEPMWKDEAGYTLLDEDGYRLCVNKDSCRIHPYAYTELKRLSNK